MLPLQVLRRLSSLSQAKQLIEETHWEHVYCCKMVRTSRGAYGLLHHSFPEPWQLYAAPSNTADMLGPCIMQSPECPGNNDIARLLDERKAEMQETFAEYLSDKDSNRSSWW